MPSLCSLVLPTLCCLFDCVFDHPKSNDTDSCSSIFSWFAPPSTLSWQFDQTGKIKVSSFSDRSFKLSMESKNDIFFKTSKKTISEGRKQNKIKTHHDSWKCFGPDPVCHHRTSAELELECCGTVMSQSKCCNINMFLCVW